MNDNELIKAGDRIEILPEWQDDGDDKFEWYAIEDEAGGRVAIQPKMDLPFVPWQRVSRKMVRKYQA
jgi:hypothetical protein